MPARKRTSGNTDYGWVGDPLQDAVLSTWVKDMLHKNTVPVCAPLSWDRELGSLLNTNADAVALFWVHQLQQLDTVKLIYAFGHAGVLTDIGNPESCVPQIAFTDLETYKQDGTIHAGMIPKLECGFQALQHGALQVLVTAYDRLDGGTQLHL
jgi:acetylglutamate kinase